MADQTLDVKGLSCPQPVLQAGKTLKKMEPGQVLEVLATDPGAPKDFEAMGRTTKYCELLESKEEEGVWTFVLKRT